MTERSSEGRAVAAVDDQPSTVTGAIAFTDIVGFTEYTANEGDARALLLLDLQLDVVEQHLGDGDRVVKQLGDGLLVWYADACRAVHQAVDTQRDLVAVAEERHLPLWVRMGIHWGCPIARNGDLIGHDVNLAARVSDRAGPGEVLVTEHLLRAADDLSDIDVAPLGPIDMKGIPDPVWLYRVR